jgi:hypothetical protein
MRKIFWKSIETVWPWTPKRRSLRRRRRGVERERRRGRRERASAMERGGRSTHCERSERERERKRERESKIGRDSSPAHHASTGVDGGSRFCRRGHPSNRRRPAPHRPSRQRRTLAYGARESQQAATLGADSRLDSKDGGQLEFKVAPACGGDAFAAVGRTRMRADPEGSREHGRPMDRYFATTGASQIVSCP